jgi:hypothetical protein
VKVREDSRSLGGNRKLWGEVRETLFLEEERASFYQKV